VLEEPELELLEPEFPVPELDDGVEVDELDVEPEPELPVVVDVVAALATNAPPATRPEVSAPMASTFRRRIFIGIITLSSRVERQPIRAGTTHGALRIWA